MDSRIAQVHNSRPRLSVDEVFGSHHLGFRSAVNLPLFFSIDKTSSQSLLSSPSRDGATISPRWSFVSTLQTIALSVFFLASKLSHSDLAARYERLLSVFAEGAEPNHQSAAKVCKRSSCRSISGFGSFGLWVHSM